MPLTRAVFSLKRLRKERTRLLFKTIRSHGSMNTAAKTMERCARMVYMDLDTSRSGSMLFILTRHTHLPVDPCRYLRLALSGLHISEHLILLQAGLNALTGT